MTLCCSSAEGRREEVLSKPTGEMILSLIVVLFYTSWGALDGGPSVAGAKEKKDDGIIRGTGSKDLANK